MKLKSLIKEHHPNGINLIPIWKLTAWDKKFNAVDKCMQKKTIKYHYYLANELDKIADTEGDIRILYTNEKISYTSSDKCNGNINEGEIVAIPWGGTPTVKYFKGRFITGDNRIATSLDKKVLNNKYLYYWMSSKIRTISEFYRGAGIKHPSMLSVLSMEIPLPHIKIQEEIVEILDSFTNLIDNLNEELSLRQKQFEYYREKLLTFDESTSKIVKLGNCGNIKGRIGFRGYTIKDQVNKGEGAISLSPGNIVEGIMNYNQCTYITWDKYNESPEIKIYEGDIIFCKTGSTVGKVSVVENLPCKATINPQLVVLKEININKKYLYYYLSSNSIQNKVKSLAGVGSVPNISQSKLNDIEITVPNPSIMESIVEKLDAFESLISSLKEEIALRQKQYEYYREKLLTFN